MLCIIVFLFPLYLHSVIWSPTLKKDIDCIERVQRHFTKRLPGLKNCSYSERLQALNIRTLELRRLHFDLVMCYKIVFGLIDISFDEFFEFSATTRTRGHCYRLYKQRPSKNARNIFFTERIINVWNFLSPITVDFHSLNSFKRSIEVVDFTMFLKSSS